MPSLMKISRVFLYIGFAAALAGVVFSLVIKEPFFIIPLAIFAILDLWVALGISRHSKIAWILGIIAGVLNLCPIIYNMNTGETIIAPINPIIGIILLVSFLGKTGREWFSSTEFSQPDNEVDL